MARLAILLGPLVLLLWIFCVARGGRPSGAGTRPRSYERDATGSPEHDRPGRAAAVDAAADEEFLRRCRERAAEQRRRRRAEHKEEDTEG
jgi:hypothetical protein